MPINIQSTIITNEVNNKLLWYLATNIYLGVDRLSCGDAFFYPNTFTLFLKLFILSKKMAYSYRKCLFRAKQITNMFAKIFT